MKAYIAAPLFSQAEKEFNVCVDAVVRSLGLDTYLPQRDGGEAARLVLDAGAREVITCVFARKPWPTPRSIEPDFAAWDAPAAQKNKANVAILCILGTILPKLTCGHTRVP